MTTTIIYTNDIDLIDVLIALALCEEPEQTFVDADYVPIEDAPEGFII